MGKYVKFLVDEPFAPSFAVRCGDCANCVARRPEQQLGHCDHFRIQVGTTTPVVNDEGTGPCPGFVKA